ncbi:MAG: PaeR7I family type II restriction endonuclease [bacterium]
MSEFKGASYAQRYDILCRKLAQESLYTTASVILSPRVGCRKGTYSELSDLTSLSAKLLAA